MNKILLFLLLSFLIINIESKAVNDTIEPLRFTNNDTCHGCERMLQDLDYLYNLVREEKVNAEYFLEKENPIGFSKLCVLTASIYDFKIFDEMIILFFSKTYYNNLKGNGDLYNVACCYAEDPILLLFYQHFLEMSSYDPTDGWLTKDIYKWAVAQERFWENADIKLVFEDIQKELDNRKRD